MQPLIYITSPTRSVHRFIISGLAPQTTNYLSIPFAHKILSVRSTISILPAENYVLDIEATSDLKALPISILKNPINLSLTDYTIITTLFNLVDSQPNTFYRAKLLAGNILVQNVVMELEICQI